jgi:hypothetical protein
MKIQISLYEFYAMGINSLVTRAPWEAGGRVSSYNESFVYEQRLLALALLLLLGEEYVPESVVRTMPKKFSAQVRNSVNQSVFLRALKNHYRALPNGDALAQEMMIRMESYITITRKAHEQNADPLEAITQTLSRRVPPRDQSQNSNYLKRVSKIFAYTEGLATRSLGSKYEIV